MHTFMPRLRCGAVVLILLLVALVALVAGCAGVGRSDTAQLADFMRQERGWAGLSTHVATLPDNTPVTYSEGGPAAAPTLVLLHGYTGDRNHWNRVARELTPRWHLIIPDLPGHGETPLDDNASADGMSNTLIDFARALGLDDYILVGHSMGGAVADLWALGQPGKTRGLVLIDAAGVYRDNPSPVMQAIARGENPLAIDTTSDYDRLLGFAMAKPPFIPDSIEHALALQAVDHRDAQGKVINNLLNVQKNLPASSFQMVLAGLRMPALILWGAKDQIFDVRVTDELATGLADSRVVIFDDVGHTPIREAPRRTARAIDGFAGEVYGR